MRTHTGIKTIYSEKLNLNDPEERKIKEYLGHKIELKNRILRNWKRRGRKISIFSMRFTPGKIAERYMKMFEDFEV